MKKIFTKLLLAATFVFIPYVTAQDNQTLDNQSIESSFESSNDSLNESNDDNDDIALVSQEEQELIQETASPLLTSSSPYKINEITIIRNNPNKYITEEAIRNQIPFKEGQTFNRFLTNATVRKLYANDLIEQVIIRGKIVEPDLINIYVIIDEQVELAQLTVAGNRSITDKEIEDELQTAAIRGINERKLSMLKKKLADLYRKKNYHFPDITSNLEIVDSKGYATIAIKENQKSLVQRVFFKGNCNISEKRLSQILMTQEDWLLGFIFKAGQYQQDLIERDKQVIEQYYKTQGYINARVTNVDVELNECDRQFYITFHVSEGEQYCVGSIRIQSHENLAEEEILRILPIQVGQVYNLKNVVDSITLLKSAYGGLGYAFVDVSPDIQPDPVTKEVHINFSADFGDRVYVNRVNIIGNEKTRDKVIRRRLVFNEGDLLTNDKLEVSKDRVMGLSFFDTQNGVNWKVTRLNKELADLDLMVKEVKTGRVALQIGRGGSPDNPMASFKSFSIAGSVMETNLLGLGSQLSINGQWAKEEWSGAITYADPYFMDKPMVLETNAHVVRTNRNEQLSLTTPFDELNTGGQVSLGYIYRHWFDTIFKTTLGLEGISISPRPLVSAPAMPGAAVYQSILDNRFQPGTMGILQEMIASDLRNHTVHPTKGYQWLFFGRLGVPVAKNILNHQEHGLGFFKATLEGSWYTPIIGDGDLIVGIHGYVGAIANLGSNIIPFRELFHVGGATTVRGWEWGQIGPLFVATPTETSGDSIGAKKCFYINTELIFPIRPDMSIKGAIFYDGGAGWDTPNQGIFSNTQDFRRHIINNNFEYRHSIGFGFRMTSPQPLRFDWGFKLDRKKGESPYAVHFSSYREF